jgi:hypothetical protein
MGLLDDAIRDHLDLKRRSGADPADIERAEREALGPVRRDPIVSDEDDGGLVPSAVVEPPPQGLGVSPGTHVEAGPVGETFGGELGDDEQSEDEDWDDYEDDDYEDDDGPDPRHSDPGPDSSAQAPRAPETYPEQPVDPHSDDDPEATRAFRIEPEPGEEAEGSGEDVLEETPDFLQDTPDHDRLWFEQRPPKDFDFDE